jgi:hypothetical protein
VWTQGARIVDTDTEINGYDTNLTWALLPDDPAVAAMSPNIDLQATLTHELGHVIGLDHPCYLGNVAPDEVDNEGNPVPSCSEPNLPASITDATMYPSATRGSIGERTLSADELLALHDLYPAGQAPVVQGPPEQTSSGGCAVAGGSSGAAGATLAAGAGALALARRRRRFAP